MSSSEATPVAPRCWRSHHPFLFTVVATLWFMNLRRDLTVLHTVPINANDAVEPDTSDATLQIHDLPIRNRNIMNFPHFMVQRQVHDDGVSQCDIQNATMLHTFNFTNHPRSYPKEEMFESYFGDLAQAWDENDSVAMRVDTDVDGDIAGELLGPPRAPANPIHTVVCTFTDYRYMHHFPHQMETIYRCWSLWRHFPKARHVFLIRPAKYDTFVSGSAFSKGMMNILKQNNVSVLAERFEEYQQHSDTPDKQGLIVAVAKKDWEFKTARADDMASLRRSTLRVLGLDRYHDRACGIEPPTNGTHESKRMEVPRIAIINRRGRRTMLGAQNVSSILQAELSLPYTPPVFYLESLSFKQQVVAFHNVDILLTPHGAQLTSIPFLPRCSSVIEVFPYGYGLVDYFGALAAISGVHHSYIYLGANMVSETRSASSPDEQKVARRASVCAPAHRMVEAVHTQIQQWNRCCESQHR